MPSFNEPCFRCLPLGFFGGEAVAGSVTVFARPEEDPGYVDDVVDADGVVVVDDVEVTVVNVLFSVSYTYVCQIKQIFMQKTNFLKRKIPTPIWH